MSNKYTHLIWLGANTATEPANLLSSAQQVTLFEAREAACLALQKQHSEPNIAVINALVTATNQTLNFTEYNLLEFSATQPASGLTKLYPGLKAQKSEQQNSIAIADVISKLSLADENNLLVVDIPDGNLTLLKALETSKHLSRFKKIYIQAPQEPLYAGAAGNDEIIAFMQTQGYLPQAITSRDPDLPWLSFSINPLWTSLQQIQRKNRELEAEQEKIKAQLNTAQENALSNQKKFDQKHIDSTKQLQSLERQCIEQKQQLVNASKQKQETEQQLAIVKQQLSAIQQELTNAQQQKSENDLSLALEKKIQKMFADQAQQIKKEVSNIKNHINTGLGNTTKQLEALNGIHNYLDRGVKPLSFHGWPISPDLGLYITGLIDENNYDAVIEFGSGTSTVLMAKILISKLRKTQITAASNNDKNINTKADINFSDSSAQIISFEHSSLYYDKTKKALQDNEVDHLVDLIHAPLVDYQYKDGSQYLYYNCNEKLKELTKIFKDRKAKFLVLVDGPPGATNKNARFPALPHLLNTLPEHSFTILIDDYNRAEEKEIVAAWGNIFFERNIRFDIEEVACQKGLAILQTQ